MRVGWLLRADCETREHLACHSSRGHHLSAAPDVSGMSVPYIGAVSAPALTTGAASEVGRYRQNAEPGGGISVRRFSCGNGFFVGANDRRVVISCGIAAG